MARDNKSNYYDAGGIETTDAIEAKLPGLECLGYFKGQAMRYLMRASFKHEKQARCLEKAAYYTRWAAEYAVVLEAAEEVLDEAPSPGVTGGWGWLYTDELNGTDEADTAGLLQQLMDMNDGKMPMVSEMREIVMNAGNNIMAMLEHHMDEGMGKEKAPLPDNQEMVDIEIRATIPEQKLWHLRQKADARESMSDSWDWIGKNP